MMTPMKKNTAGHLARLCLASALLSSSGARADCAGDFARDNAFKPEAGAVRILERKLPMSLLDDGRWVPTLKQETVNTVSELVPPNAVRISSDALIGMVGLVVLGDKAGFRTAGIVPGKRLMLPRARKWRLERSRPT